MALPQLRPRRLRRRLVALAVCGFIATVAVSSIVIGVAHASSTWYVSTTGSGVACSVASPCTLDEALSLASSGDAIELEGGDYTDAAVGASGLPVTIDPGSAETLTIENDPGTGSVYLDGGGAYQLMYVGPEATVTVSGLTAENGLCSTDCTEGSLGGGGGAFESDGVLTVTDSTFTNDTESGTVPSWGGGALFTSGTLLTVIDSTFDDDNTGDTGYVGGAIRGKIGKVVVESATFDNDTDVSGANDIADRNGSTIYLAGDILADGCSGNVAYVDDGYNAAASGSGCTSAATGDVTDAKLATDLGSLANNGGTTQTIEPIAGAPEIGAVPDPTSVTVNGNSDDLCPQTDQTGASSGTNACTIGSVYVTPPVLTTTTTTVSPSANPVTAPASVTYTATVTLSSNVGSPTGTVAFDDGATSITGCGSEALSGSGTVWTASCANVPYSSSGSHSITAVFAGDGNYSTSTSTALTEVVRSAAPPPVANPTATSVAVSPTSAITGQTVTLTATVTSSAGDSQLRFWLYRLAGVPLVAVCVYLVVTHATAG